MSEETTNEVQEEPIVDSTPEVIPEEEKKDLGFEWNDRLDALARGEKLGDEEEVEEEVEEEEAQDEVQDEVQDEAQDEPVEEEEDWLTPDVASLGKAYGISLDELSEFKSREEFDRAISFWERRSEQREEEPAKKKEDGELRETDENGFINPDYYEKNDFDDATVALVKSLRATQEEAFSLRQYTMQQQQQQELNAFHDAVDAYDPEFYGMTIDDTGRPVNIEQAAADRRSALLGEAYAVADRIAKRQRSSGQEVQLPPWRSLIQQADKILFGREREAQKKQATARIAAQSKKRRPVSSTAATRPTARRKAPDPRNPSEIANDPDIIRFMEKVGIKT
jgi:hypothetical protein